MSAHHDAAHDAHHDGLGQHVSSVQTYVAVFGALLLFTGLTYAVSFADLGPFAFPVAMLVACTKAFLVASFFMHLKYDEKFNILVFASSLFFVGVFFAFTMLDISSRGNITPVESHFFYRDEVAAAQAEADAAAAREAAAAAAEAGAEAGADEAPAAH